METYVYDQTTTQPQVLTIDVQLDYQSIDLQDTSYALGQKHIASKDQIPSRDRR